jgi:hypothetical protein
MTATIHQMPAAPDAELTDAELADIMASGVTILDAEPMPTGATTDLVAASVSAPLYAVEEELAVWFDTAEFVTPDQEQAFLTELGAAMRAAIAKRDRVAGFMAHCDAQIDHAAREIERLAERQAVYQSALDRMESYVVRILETFERDGRGRSPRLEGTTVTMSLRACPVAVDILDETEIPDDYKIVSPRMPAALWNDVLDGLDLELRARVVDAVGEPSARVARDAIKRAIDAGLEVAGADLLIGRYSLVRK